LSKLGPSAASKIPVNKKVENFSKGNLSPRTPVKQENLILNDLDKRKPQTKQPEKFRTTSIGPIRTKGLKERVNLNVVEERLISNKDETPTFTSKEQLFTPIKEERAKRPLSRPTQIESFSFSRHGTSPQPIKPLKVTREEQKKKLDSGSKTSAKEYQPSTTVEDSPNSLKGAKQTSNEADPDCVMTSEDERTYGKRFIVGYEKIKLLGKGGQGLVWLAKRKENNELVAVKQIAIGGFFNEKTARKEIEINDTIFNLENGGDNLASMGKNCLIQVIDYTQTAKDLFMVLELAGQCLSKQIYSMKGEFMKSERVYKVKFL
jgi:hypothetical protein